MMMAAAFKALQVSLTYSESLQSWFRGAQSIDHLSSFMRKTALTAMTAMTANQALSGELFWCYTRCAAETFLNGEWLVACHE